MNNKNQLIYTYALLTLVAVSTLWVLFSSYQVWEKEDQRLYGLLQQDEKLLFELDEEQATLSQLKTLREHFDLYSTDLFAESSSAIAHSLSTNEAWINYADKGFFTLKYKVDYGNWNGTINPFLLGELHLSITQLKTTLVGVQNQIQAAKIQQLYASFLALITALILFGMALYKNSISPLGAWYYSQEKAKKGIEGLFALPQLLLKKYEQLKTLMEKSERAIAAIGKEGFTAEADEALLAHPIGKSIFSLNKQLKEVAEEEEKRNWSVTGMATFGDILRRNMDNFDKLTDTLISELVKYMKANQGALFILNREAHDGEEEGYLTLASAYAYNRKKYFNKKLGLKEGLVGQCVLDRKSIFMDDIPEQYISITSGLGDANPKNLVLIPLLSNEQVMGVIEIASFHKIEPHQIAFLEQLGESIAGTLYNLRISKRTQKLLQESEENNAELSAREEELRQNAEEMQATQEEMQRQTLELNGIFESINAGLLRMDLDENGVITSANDNFERKIAISDFASKGIKQKEIISKEKISQDFEQSWNALLRGHTFTTDVPFISSNGELIWASITYAPVKLATGELQKILALGTDITSQKQQEEEFKKLSLVTDNTNNAVIITDAKGLIEYVNKGYTDMTGYGFKESLGKKPGDFLQGPETNKETVKRISKKLRNREPIYEEILNYSKTGETYWVSLVINPVYDENGEVEKFISVQANITETKNKAQDFALILDAVQRSNAVIDLGLEGEIQNVNELFLQLSGYDKNKIVSTPLSSFFLNSEERENFKSQWPKILAGDSVSSEITFIGSGKKTITLRGIFTPIFDIHNQTKRVTFFASDISEQKALEQITAQKEKALEEFADAVDHTIGSLYLSPNLEVLKANTIFEGITGFSNEDLKGNNFETLLPSDESERERFAMLTSSLKEGKFLEGEFQLVDKEGRKLWFQGTFNPIKRVDGSVERIVLLAQFTTDTKKTMSELKEYVQLYQNLMPSLELDTQGVMLKANKNFMQLSGYGRRDVMKKSFAEILDKDFIADFDLEKTMQQAIQEGEAHLYVELALKNEEIQPARVAFMPFKDFNQEVVKVIVVVEELVKSKMKVAS